VACAPLAAAAPPLPADPALPPEALDYRGVTAENFFERIEALDPAPPRDYSLPAHEPSRALIVDPDGIGGKPGDENPGTLDRPFSTLARALKELKPGTLVLLRKGTHRIRETIILDKQNGQTGTAEFPAVVASFPGEVAVVTAGWTVSDWAATPVPGIYEAALATPAGKRSALWWEGRLLPSAQQHLRLASTNASGGTAGTAPLPGDMPLPTPGTWAADGARLLLRPPRNADPRPMRIEFDTLLAESRGSIEIRGGEWIVFHRLAFRTHLQAATAVLSRNVVFRHCRFVDCLYGLTFFGGDQERGIVDGCLFQRVGGPSGGEPIYTTSGITVRNSLFIDNAPQLAVCAYTSKNDMFSGLRVVGNTFLRAGSCITSTGRGSLIKDNLAFASRFLSSAGSEARIEGNVAVYDPGDMARFPHIPRRDIGFRMYGAGTLVRGNTLAGFDQGGAVVPHAGSPTSASLVGNRFAGYREFALRASSLDGLTLQGNAYSPASPTNAMAVYLKSAEGVREFLTLEDLRKRGAEADGRCGGPPPPLPAILREALEARLGEMLRAP
jgi:hypothetical protein